MRTVVVAIIVGALAALVPYATPQASSTAMLQCGEGMVLSADGTVCAVPTPTPTPISCPDGQAPDASGRECVKAEVEATGPCPEGTRLSEDGTLCASPIPTPAYLEADESTDAAAEDTQAGAEPAGEPATVCDPGYSVAADGQTCIADAPKCADNEVVGDDGTCIVTFQCSPGLILTSDMLTCTSRGCEEGEIVSVDGKRCVSSATACPDGSPRPVGGACLVVETVEAADGSTEVVVRCDEADVFCQSLIKDCAERKAAGESTAADESCADPRASCDENDSSCAEANERLVECATRGTDDGGPATLDPCADLCPDLHRLDESGECVEYLDPTHPCVSWGRVPSGVTTNDQLAGYSYLAGLGQCVTRAEFYRRLANFEAAAGAEADALALLRETTSAYLTVEERLADLESRLAMAEADVAEYTAQAAAADAKRVDNEQYLVETRAVLDEELELLRDEVVEVYVVGDSRRETEMAILRATSLSEVALAQAYGAAVLDDQIDNVGRIERLEADAVTYGVELDAAIAEVESSLEAAIATNAAVEILLAEADQLRSEQLQRRNDEAELVSELRADKAAYAQELGVFDQSSRQIADIISESEFIVNALESGGDGLFGDPVLPATVVSGFGPRLHPILGYVRNHNGLDFDANFGDSVYASKAGLVQIASSFGGYGQTVVIDHGGGNLTLYAHMSAILVEVGDEVDQGDVVGNIGSTGLSTGPHLHFEIWVDGRVAVDPLPYLSLGDRDDDETADGDAEDEAADGDN